MKKIKIAMIVAALALGTAGVSTDALAQRGGHGGGGHFGGGGGAHFGGGHFSGRAGGGPMGGGFSGGHFGGGRAFAHRGPVRGFGGPFYSFGSPYYDDYACWPYQYNRPWNYAYCY